MIAELLPFALGLLVTGVIAGVLSGLLGVGGGIVIVPVLYYVFHALGIDDGILMHLAVGTSLATIIPTTIRSMMKHAEHGAVDFQVLRAWVPGILIGVVAGAFIAGVADGKTLTLIFAVFALVFAANLAFVKESWTLGRAVPTRVGGTAMAASMGTLSTLMGIGGGTMGVTMLTLFAMPIHRAVATAAGFGMVIAIPGALSYVINGWGVEGLPPGSIGYVNLIGFALIVPATWAAAPLGVKLAHAMDRAMLRRVFAIFLAITSVKMFWDYLS